MGRKCLVTGKAFRTGCISILVILFLSCMINFTVYAESEFKVDVEDYQTESSVNFDISSNAAVDIFSYGKSFLGTFALSGGVCQETVYKGVKAFGVNDNVTFSYDYAGDYNDRKGGEWHLNLFPITDINNTIGGSVVFGWWNTGTVLIQKSKDGTNWENAAEPVLNSFDEEKCVTYTTAGDDIKNGMFYRLIAAYRMGYDSKPAVVKNCVEIYKFYVEDENGYVVMRDLENRKQIGEPYTVDRGFIIDKSGSESKVTVKCPGGERIEAGNFQTFCDPGKYGVEVSSKLNYVFSYEISVTTGSEIERIESSVYESEIKTGFGGYEEIEGTNSLGFVSNTQLYIGQNAGKDIKCLKKDGAVPVYGICGENVGFYMKLRYPVTSEGQGFQIDDSKWGEKEEETIEGINYGKVGTGLLIIQKSDDGVNWKDVEKGRLSDGLACSDYGNCYPAGEDVMIYRPEGSDVLKGTYYRIMYAFQASRDKTKRNYLETYVFYLCSDELDAVTFHNCSLTGEIEEEYGDQDENVIEVCRKSETLRSGDMSTTGFRIDMSLNPTVSYSVWKNGKLQQLPEDGEFHDTGKYHVALTSAAGSVKELDLYIDALTPEESVDNYFGSGLITGKRIYSEGEFPVYEGRKTNFQLKGVSEEFLPVKGEIRNLTTGSIKSIGSTRQKLSGRLDEPGVYEAVFETVSQAANGIDSGDRRIFTFRFEVIASGSAPGPIINQRSLAEYAASTVSDSYPLYYGVTYSSAAKGNITLAFASREAAFDYAYNYEKGTVELQSDGSYRYNGSFHVSQKEKYDSNWDLMDAVNYFAGQAVQPLYFDLTDQFTVLTLKGDVTKTCSNLRALELDRSVVVYANDGQKAELTDTGCLPVISRKPYSYLTGNDFDRVETGFLDFEFVSDKYGCDSDSVVITDCNGKEYDIKYGMGVGEQLTGYGCPSGVVTVTETTIYGDSVSYEAVFINDGDNTSRITISYTEHEEENSRRFTENDEGSVTEVKSFCISSITDELDPCGLVLVSHGGELCTYTADSVSGEVWTDPGEYIIKSVNRLGYNYSFTVLVKESKIAAITFSDGGEGPMEHLITEQGAVNVKLPEMTRYGYTFEGFEDSEGNRFTDEVTVVDFVGTREFTALWKPKEYALTMEDTNGVVIKKMQVRFGESYELPVPETSDGTEFVGWMLDDALLEENVLTVDEEKNITLIARTRVTDITGEDQNDEGTERKSPFTVPVVIAAVCGLLIVLWGLRKKSFGCRNRREENDEH